jgi:hypothetical protein
VVPVEGPENAQTEYFTLRSKPVSRTFFEEAAEQIESINRLIEEAEKILIGFDKGRNHDKSFVILESCFFHNAIIQETLL